MTSIIKLIVWLAGILVIAYFVLGFLGYEINRDYFNSSKASCEEKLKNCSNELIHKGIDNAQCNVDCANPELIIKKKNKTL